MLPQFRIVKYRGWYYAAWQETGGIRRRALRTKNLEIAKQTLKSFENAYEVANRPEVITVEFCWNAYRETLVARPAWSTMGHEARPVLEFFGTRAATDINERDCSDYRDLRHREGRKDGTIRTELGRLWAALRWAERNNIIAKAPAIYRPPMPPPRDLRLTRKEAARFLAACAMPHIRLFVILAMTSGARMGALLGLKWDRVDFDGRTIDLHDPTRPRTHKGRPIVPMNRTAAAALSEARAGALTPYVIEWGGRKRQIKSIKHALANVGKSCGLPWVTAHVFRHSVATWLAEDGISMLEIAKLLGHSDSRTTEKSYAHLGPSYLREAAEALEIDTLAEVKGNGTR